MVEFTKTIKDPLGLHARPVALLYDIIAKHRSDEMCIRDRLEAMWCSRKLRSMVAAGPFGSVGTVSAARDMMVLRLSLIHI